MHSISATYRLPALPASEPHFIWPGPRADEEIGPKWDTEKPREGPGDQLGLVIAALAQAAWMQGYWYHRVCRKALHRVRRHLRELARKPAAQRRDFPILQQQDRAGHGRRISAETSNEIKVICAEAAEVAQWRRSAFGHGARNDRTAAPCALRFGECLRKQRDALAAERDASACVQHPGTNPAWRGKHYRGERLAYLSHLGTHRNGNPVHDAVSLLLNRNYLNR